MSIFTLLILVPLFVLAVFLILEVDVLSLL